MERSTNPPMIVMSIASRSTRVNRPFTELLGFSNDEFCTEPLQAWLHPDDRPAMNGAMDAGDGQVRARVRSKRGSWVPFHFHVKTHDGAPAVLGVLHINSKSKAQRELPTAGHSRTELQETLEAMAYIVEEKNRGMKCSILLIDPETARVVVGAGPSLPKEYNTALAGLRIGPTVGSCGSASFWNVAMVVEDIAADPLWHELRDTAAIAGVAACWSHPITATNGEVLGAMALYSSTPSRPEKHHMDGLEIAARMVGLAIERDRLENQLRQASKMEAIGVLAGGIAHDFNNMLVAVLGNAELALSGLPDNAPATQNLRDIVTASMSAAELCNQILGYSGKRASVTEPLDCNSLVREIGSLAQVTFSKKARLSYDLEAGAVGIMGDRSQLGQVIMNLVTNASEAIGNNEGRIIIGTRAGIYSRKQLRRYAPDSELPPGDYVRLWVTDTGIGMSRTTQARIFDPFFTTKHTGRGLGLAAVQGIIRGHNGALTTDSTEGVGTTFSVFLPQVLLPPPSPASGPRAVAPAHARILIVDDDPMVRSVLKTILETAGYIVVCARDGLECVNLFRHESNAIDCVLLDLSMPKLDGEEVFRELRQLRNDVKIILCSGYAEQEIIERFEWAELAGVLKKPATATVVLEKVAEALSKLTE